MSKSICLATCDYKPEGTPDDILVAKALRELGAKVDLLPWSSETDWSAFDGVWIRSTWDYYKVLPRFLKWATEVDSKSKLIHTSSLVEWNSDKTYLRELETQGIPIVPTLWSDRPDLSDIDSDQLRSFIARHDTFITKPSISATSDLTDRLSESTYQPWLESQTPAQILKRATLMVQPFMEAVLNDGELSLIFRSSEGQSVGEATPVFEHAILKKARAGDYRVQSEFGGTSTRVSASKALIELSEKTLKLVEHPWLYARVDWLDFESDPKLGELEMIEPDLFMRENPGSEIRFASRLIELIGKDA